MVCYDADRFREFVISEGFTELYDTLRKNRASRDADFAKPCLLLCISLVRLLTELDVLYMCFGRDDAVAPQNNSKT